MVLLPRTTLIVLQSASVTVHGVRRYTNYHKTIHGVALSIWSKSFVTEQGKITIFGLIYYRKTFAASTWRKMSNLFIWTSSTWPPTKHFHVRGYISSTGPESTDLFQINGPLEKKLWQQPDYFARMKVTLAFGGCICRYRSQSVHAFPLRKSQFPRIHLETKHFKLLNYTVLCLQCHDITVIIVSHARREKCRKS